MATTLPHQNARQRTTTSTSSASSSPPSLSSDTTTSCIPAIVMTFPTANPDAEEQSVVLLSPSLVKSPTKLRRPPTNAPISSHSYPSEKAVGLGIHYPAQYPYGSINPSSGNAMGLAAVVRAMKGLIFAAVAVALVILASVAMTNAGVDGHGLAGRGHGRGRAAMEAVPDWLGVKGLLKYKVQVEQQWIDKAVPVMMSMKKGHSQEDGAVVGQDGVESTVPVVAVGEEDTSVMDSEDIVDDAAPATSSSSKVDPETPIIPEPIHASRKRAIAWRD